MCYATASLLWLFCASSPGRNRSSFADIAARCDSGRMPIKAAQTRAHANCVPELNAIMCVCAVVAVAHATPSLCVYYIVYIFRNRCRATVWSRICFSVFPVQKKNRRAYACSNFRLTPENGAKAAPHRGEHEPHVRNTTNCSISFIFYCTQTPQDEHILFIYPTLNDEAVV